MFQAEQESDGFGWISVTSPIDWWRVLEAYNRYNRNGRPTRIVEVDGEGDFIREVTASEILMERPDK